MRDLLGLDLLTADLLHQNFPGAWFGGPKLPHQNFPGANFSGAQIAAKKRPGAKFTKNFFIGTFIMFVSQKCSK